MQTQSYTDHLSRPFNLRRTFYLQVRIAYQFGIDMERAYIKDIISILVDHPDGLRVKQLTIQLFGQYTEVYQAMTSQNLRLLRRHRIVTVQKHGKHRRYHVDTARILRINSALHNFFNP